MIENNNLYHSGVFGMHWGIRKSSYKTNIPKQKTYKNSINKKTRNRTLSYNDMKKALDYNDMLKRYNSMQFAKRHKYLNAGKQVLKGIGFVINDTIGAGAKKFARDMVYATIANNVPNINGKGKR